MTKETTVIKKRTRKARVAAVTEAPKIEAIPLPAEVAADSKPAPVETTTAPGEIVWNKQPKKTSKPVLSSCMVIDKYMRWHQDIKIDLKGMDTSGFTWGYYGRRYAVLKESEGKLVPYCHTDMVGESPSRLYKAAHPEGFRNTFKHNNSTLQKIQLGLMVALVFGIFMLIYVLINSKG